MPEKQRRCGARQGFGRLEPDEVRAEREELWEEKLLALAKIARVDPGKQPARKLARDKVRLAAALKQSTAVSNGWLASRLGRGESASASQFVRRYLLTDDGRAAANALLSRVKT